MVRGGRPEHAGGALTPRPWWSGPQVLEPVGPDAPFDLVLLDRDGTLNERITDGYVRTPDELVLLPGAGEAVARINRAGSRTVLVTNQRGLARGLLTRADLEAVHARLADELAAAGARLDAIVVCPHGHDECACRKPRDGLFREALARAPWADPARCLMIGDMPSDLAPAAGLGMGTVRVGATLGLGGAVGDRLGRGSRDDGPDELRRGEGHVL
ncbi:D-glycero-alpha-D-manno-heptose-1,7-bisphosphate 7-phosphatase [Janibacter sp. GS2]|uniref:D-glycero-alpha-D-manno-heptose-1,7-bisphosphate 7-phosphatase n=1 Tax=Janibacter sp. GS2 TaxID=3442646 RepID=UPI003EBBB7B7